MGDTKEVLTLAVEVGEAMLRCGAEIYRVEDSVIRILKAFGLDDFDAYVLSNGIFASANEKQEDACSVVRYVPLSAMHLGKLAALSQLTRDICAHTCSVKEAAERLERCKKVPSYRYGIQLLACAIGCAAFTLMYGGRVADAVYAFLIGLTVQMALVFCKKRKISRFLTNIYVSLMISVLSLPVALHLIPLLHDKIVIGAIMPLVPGVALTTSIRDFYNSDYLSGTIHLIDALLTALCIAVGIALPLLAVRYVAAVFGV